MPRFPYYLILVSLIFVGIYVFVVVLVANNGPTTKLDNVAPNPDVMQMILTPKEMNASGDRLVADIGFREGGPVSSPDGRSVTKDISVYLTSERSGQELDFIAGRPIAPTQVSLSTTGSIEQWPFDTHFSETLVYVYQPESEGQAEISVPTEMVLGDHDLPGWKITASHMPGSEYVDEENSVVIHTYKISIVRAPATIVFSLVLLALMVMLPILGLTIAVLCLRGKRKAEVGFLTWNAGMLFATPTLRNFLPGQPPIGSWVDYLVVLWVIAALILALLFSVIAWYRQQSHYARSQQV